MAVRLQLSKIRHGLARRRVSNAINMTVRGPRQCCTVFIIPAAGFVEEMRFVAMKLHTKDQAPKEGGKEAAKQPFQQVSQSMCGDQLHSCAGAQLDMHDTMLQQPEGLAGS